MANDPAFLFYPGDYLRDTQCLSETVQVAYDRIICEHMRNICITQAQLNFFTKRFTEEQKSELMMVVKPTKGGFHIPWVSESIVKRREYSESRRKNRKGKEKDMSNISKTYDSHMEIENEIVIEDEIEDKIKSAFDDIYINQEAMKWPHLDFEFECNTFMNKVRGSPGEYKKRDTNSLRLAFQYQLRNSKGKKNGHTKKQSPADLAEALAMRMAKDAGIGQP